MRSTAFTPPILNLYFHPPENQSNIVDRPLASGGLEISQEDTMGNHDIQVNTSCDPFYGCSEVTSLDKRRAFVC